MIIGFPQFGVATYVAVALAAALAWQTYRVAGLEADIAEAAAAQKVAENQQLTAEGGRKVAEIALRLQREAVDDCEESMTAVGENAAQNAAKLREKQAEVRRIRRASENRTAVRREKVVEWRTPPAVTVTMSAVQTRDWQCQRAGDILRDVVSQ